MPLTAGVTVTGDADARRPWRFVDVITATKKETSHVRQVAGAAVTGWPAGTPACGYAIIPALCVHRMADRGKCVCLSGFRSVGSAPSSCHTYVHWHGPQLIRRGFLA